MPSGKNSKAVRNARSVVTATKPRPWGTLIAVLAVLVFAGGVFGYMYTQYQSAHAFTPSADNQDPSTAINGIVIKNYGPQNRGHISADQRVGYDQSPPFGGPHDATWAACDGEVYTKAVRNENMVHALEHGAVWIAYNPARVSGSALQGLRDKVQGQNQTMLSPYPGLDATVSLQSWGHQLKVNDPGDERIDEFIRSLRGNQYTYPEVGASCDVLPGSFDPANPPPFVATPPGPGAIPMNYGGGRGAGPTSGGVMPDTPAPGGQPAPAPSGR